MRTDNEIVYFQKQIKKSLDFFEERLYCSTYENHIKESYFLNRLDVLNYEGEVYKHNCLPCNLADGANLIQYFLKNNLNCENIRFFINTYSIILYQQAERFGVIYCQLDYRTNKNEFDWSLFPNLQKIKYWANFFKHPKSFMFIHHPTFHIENYQDNPNFMFDGYVNSEFVKKYFSGPKFNLQLESLLLNKDFKVFFPDLIDFTKLICDESENLINTILSNEEYIKKLQVYRNRI